MLFCGLRRWSRLVCKFLCDPTVEGFHHAGLQARSQKQWLDGFSGNLQEDKLRTSNSRLSRLGRRSHAE